MASGKVHIPVQLRSRASDRRAAERIPAEMPISVDGHGGRTADLSASGLSFIADRPYAVGATVDVVIDYLLDGHQYPLHCQAEVVRVAPTGSGYAVGARLAPQSGEMLEVRGAMRAPDAG